MPSYKRFEDLPVWQTAAELYEASDDFLEHAPPRLRSAFRNQLERAVLSVSNNVAEGFERGTTKELLAFNYIARGSAGEIRSMLSCSPVGHGLRSIKEKLAVSLTWQNHARASFEPGPNPFRILRHWPTSPE
jgi:four helix bundle protein